MRLAMYTLWGLYQTYPEILDNIDFPEEMDKTTMLDYIFMYAGENEVRYPHPAVLERLVNKWFSSRKHDFVMMWRALRAEYNPIENTDRYEDSWRTIERDGEGTEKRDSSNSVERTNSQTSEVNGETSGNGTTTGETSGNGTITGESTRTPNLATEETVSAFDSESYQPDSRRSESGTESTNNTETTHTSANNTETTNTSANSSQTAEQNGNENETATENANINRTEKSKDTEKTGLHSHGNIGITTNQEMINEELELRKFDIYKAIALVFEDEFTIPVYSRRSNEYGLL